MSINAASKRFDLIVLDINMPVSDGWEAIKNIKRIYNNGFVPVDIENSANSSQKAKKTLNIADLKPIFIAVSGLVTDSIYKRAIDSGFEEMYEVPLQMKDIGEQIIPLLNNRVAIIKQKLKVMEQL